LQTYKYSEKNEYDFELPEKYEKLLQSDAKETNKSKKKFGAADIVPLAIKIVAVVGILVLFGIIGKKVYAYYTDIAFNEAKRSEVRIDTDSSNDAEKRKTPDYPEYEGSDERVVTYPQVVEIEKLKQLSLVYPDFVCWFYIENTSISYPVVYNSTPDYYLRKNMDGEENLSGTLYFDFRNDRKKLDRNTIIYGHAMQNGTMFGTLKDYQSKSYYDNHSTIYLYTPTEVIVYKIFAAYETTTDNYYIETYFSSTSAYKSFLDGCKANSAYDTGVEIAEDSDILTLSTCHYYNSNNGRFVVQAVKVGSSPLV